jgi:hypothetical protein
MFNKYKSQHLSLLVLKSPTCRPLESRGTDCKRLLYYNLVFHERAAIKSLTRNFLVKKNIIIYQYFFALTMCILCQ